MYKDKDKQREAKRLSAQRRRTRLKGTTSGTTRVGTTHHVIDYYVVPGQTVYGRLAVRYPELNEAWDLRPQPDSPEDMPKLDNRGKYICPDGSQYQIDACGKRFDCSPSGEVYSGDSYKAARQAEIDVKEVAV